MKNPSLIFPLKMIILHKIKSDINTYLQIIENKYPDIIKEIKNKLKIHLIKEYLKE